MVDAADFGYATPYILSALSCVAMFALAYIGAWIIAAVLTVLCGGVSFYFLSQIEPDQHVIIFFGITAIGMLFFFLAAGGVIGTVAGVVLRYLKRRNKAV